MEHAQASAAHGHVQAMAAHSVFIVVQHMLQSKGALALRYPKVLTNMASLASVFFATTHCCPVCHTLKQLVDIASVWQNCRTGWCPDSPLVKRSGSLVWCLPEPSREAGACDGFFKISYSCACCRAKDRNYPCLAAIAGSNSAPKAGALLGQAQGFGAKGHIILTAFVGLWCVFHDEGKTLPCSVQLS